MLVDKRIADFAARHHVLTVATVSATGEPYCAACFYAYDRERNLFIFTSDRSTRHGAEMTADSRVACNIALETRIVGKVQGLQICGTAHEADEAARTRYLKRFPYAVAAPLTLWAIEPTMMKLTDNTLGFGKKLIWNKE